MMDAKMESPIRFSKNKIEMESNKFKVCTTSFVKTGIIHKKIVYAHHDGKELIITIVDLANDDITRL
jgi:hypothetical protein